MLCEVNVKLLDFKDLRPAKGINYSRDHLRRKCRAGEFPKPVRISEHRISWLESEVDTWLVSKKRARDEKPALPLE